MRFLLAVLAALTVSLEDDEANFFIHAAGNETLATFKEQHKDSKLFSTNYLRQRTLMSGMHSKTNQANTYIVGGQPSKIGSFPWYVSTTGAIHCGASLVHHDVALGASHCYNGYAPGSVVEIGANLRDLDNEWNTHRIVTQTMVHPQFDPDNLNYDFMLFKLNAPVPDVVPIRLNSDASIPANNATVTIMGFGKHSKQGSMQTVLHDVDLYAIDSETCARLYSDVTALDGSSQYNLNPNVTLCAGDFNGNKGHCGGDSGGPLITAKTASDGGGILIQVGVLSGGVGCGRPNFPGLYARVSSAFEWIQSGICILSDDPPTECNN